ncbi:protein kinase domain-containing protein [Sorangium sp. So ce1335]|uniref:protein kinase domain-containing protein n=1 Tax=Sorangium sp. So ce1335 TaxID=3133335 RepID=UPI003F624A22
MRSMADAAGGPPGFSSGSENGGDPAAPLVPDVADTLQGVDTVVRDRSPVRVGQPVDRYDESSTLSDEDLALAATRSSMHDGGSPVQVPPDGTILGGVYRILGRLGEGAMGVILLARDEQLQRDVAIKLLRPEQLDNAQMQARLLAEARAMARVHHPNVVEIYAFGEYGNAPYFVMQYVPGVTLDSHVHSKGGRLGLDEALSILDQVCLGVSAIHASGIAHRDVKPSNILVGHALRVVVADLGLAKRIPRGDRIELAFSGTPAYLAPEVALGRQLDPALLPRIDVYALGVVAYYLLAGRLPFQSTSTVDLVMQHAYQPPIPPSELCLDLPSSFDAPVLAALAKEPDQRTASADALREALLDARSAMPTYARSTRVMVADDSPSFRAFLVSVLAQALPGAIIETAPDGTAALAAIEANPPSLGVFDLDMPGLDGIALTAAVRKLPKGGDFPIIVATGTGGAADWQCLSRLGASAFLVKPFDAGQLITLARAFVGVADEQKRKQ